MADGKTQSHLLETSLYQIGRKHVPWIKRRNYYICVNVSITPPFFIFFFFLSTCPHKYIKLLKGYFNILGNTLVCFLLRVR